MPDYKKQKRRKALPKPKKNKAKNIKSNDTDIIMTPHKKSKLQKTQNDMKLVRGRKEEKKKRAKRWVAVALCLVLAVTLLNTILPAGIIRTVSNSLALIGTGNYPVSLESSDTLSVESMGSYYYILSDTSLSAYSNSGKKLYSYVHGFEKPILKCSKWGAMLFGQSENTVLIFDLKKLKKTIETKKAIINGNISDSGGYAVITQSDNYASAVTVYNRYGKELYEWYSAEDTVNSVTIAPNNKKIAVSSFKVVNGEYLSKVSVLNFESATPEYTEEYKGGLVYNLSSSASGRFTVVTSNGIDFIKWRKYSKTQYKNDYNITLLREASHGMVAVFSRESNRTDNKIAVFSKTGKIKFQFDFKGIISDIRFFGGHIYCMSDTDVFLIDETGKTVKKTSCGFGGVRLVVTGSNTVAVVTDNKIERIKLVEKE